MSNTLSLVVLVSLAVITAELLYRLVTRDRGVRFLPRVMTLATAAFVLFVLMPRGRAQQMGSLDELASILVCYASMLLGMGAEYGYSMAERAARGEERQKFDKLAFLMPIFASPIIFIPLLTLTAELGVGGAFARARLMVYLIAFQNGFFWKHLFEQRREAVLIARGEPAKMV